MASASEESAFARLWSRYQGLVPAAKTVLRLKALIGSATNKTLFFKALAATGSRAPGGKAWTLKAVNPVLGDLVVQGLLDDGFVCPAALLHPLAVDAAGSTDGPALTGAVRACCPAGPRPYYYGYDYSMLGEDNALRLLRLAICVKAETAYRRLL